MSLSMADGTLAILIFGIWSSMLALYDCSLGLSSWTCHFYRNSADENYSGSIFQYLLLWTSVILFLGVWSSILALWLLVLPLLLKLRCRKFTAALFSNATINEPQLFLSMVFGPQCWPSRMTLLVPPLNFATFIETQVLKNDSSFILQCHH